ncbi:MAG: DNA primase [Flavobacteriales bacterium]|nr:DNA primase [Flavobacteriales bacterium]|tara:strand:+ start:22447 stop:24354 length:1908 start_codon:yes stop_codon:yes gene_type:complete
MIPKETVDKIFDSIKIEEVITDYLPDLKKRGTNYWACCPFHNEKTPSFSVSPTKGIYKCFGCGAGGNAVNFVMEIGSLSYPEALKELALKYNIEIKEKELTPEQIDKENKRDGIYLISSYANKFFQEQLWETEEGKIIGLSYFKQRGYSEETIKKFQLGFSPKQKDALSKQAIKNLYQKEFLEESGLSFFNERGCADRFKERVIFPIHNYSGKVLGFGGRALDPKNKAKYLNSPENPIYNKSKVLYGLYFAKLAIGRRDNCFIVEGYTDVISMYQAGVENVVSASGTALSTEQINLIGRLTKNITLLFDGDEAGLRASFKSIDLILREGMNVKVVMFPEGEDPDSYSKMLSQEDFINYLSENSKDFIQYKSELLNKNSKNDPAKRVKHIKDIARSISVIPDRLLRSEYCKVSSSLLDVSEQDLLREVSLFLQEKKKVKFIHSKTSQQNKIAAEIEKKPVKTNLLEVCEKEILRLLFNYGNEILEFEDEKINVSEYIMGELHNDNITFSNSFYKQIMNEYKQKILEKKMFNLNHFLNHENSEIQQLSISFVSKKHEISKKWEDIHHIFTGDETKNLELTIEKAVLSLKQAFIKNEIEQINKRISDEEDPSIIIITKLTKLNKALVIINKLLGRNFN